MSIKASHDTDGLDHLDPAVHRGRDAVHFRRILAARAAGDSWTVIAAALDTTRQAAQQRFGRD